MIELTPATEDVVDLLTRMIHLEWPTTERDRLRYFNSLGLHDLDLLPRREDDPDSLSRRFSTPLPGEVDGICTMFRGEFLGLSLFCYNGPQARAGYAGLKSHLSRTFGTPIEEWGSPSELACLWRSGPLMLDMYCFQRLSSGIMIGPSHVERSAANDDAQEQAAPQPQQQD
jgi:hypothetical protein